jgi:hypothetical protein
MCVATINRRNPAEQVDAELDHVHPHDRAQPNRPGVHERDEPDRDDSDGHAPVGDDRQRNRRGEDPNAIGERAREQKDAGCHAPRERAEAMLEPLVGGVPAFPRK